MDAIHLSYVAYREWRETYSKYQKALGIRKGQSFYNNFSDFWVDHIPDPYYYSDDDFEFWLDSYVTIEG